MLEDTDVHFPQGTAPSPLFDPQPEPSPFLKRVCGSLPGRVVAALNHEGRLVIVVQDGNHVNLYTVDL